MKIKCESLLDYLHMRMNCVYLSDLRFLDAYGCWRLAWELRQISPDAASLSDWNDALEYLAGKENAASAEAARETLIWHLEHAAKEPAGTGKNNHQ